MEDYHYKFDDRILRDYAPSTFYYLAGLIDGDGYLGKNTIEITLHAKEISVLYRIQAMFHGTVGMRDGTNSCRWRLSKGRKEIINNIHDKVLTVNKIKQLNDYYGIVASNNSLNESAYFDY